MNLRSRLTAFTIALLGFALPALAHADRVVLYPVSGRAEQDRLSEVEELLASVLREQGHTIVPPAGTARPVSSAQMEAAATGASATYVVVAELEPLRAQYRLQVRVYYRPAGRNEDLVATVLEAEERARLSDILSSMVRREGLGEDALRLTGSEPPPEGETDEQRRAREAAEAQRREAEETQRREAERSRTEAEEAMRREAEEQAQREAEERARDQAGATRAWNERVQYGADGHWMGQLVVGGSYATRLGQLPGRVQSNDGGLLDVGLRLGRTFDGIDGFEVRGGLDLITGSFAGPVIGDGTAPSVGLTALGLHVGAAWLGSFFTDPVYIGVGGEIGVIFTLTGGRDVGFSARAGALFAWRPTERILLEASIPELGVITPGSGAFTIGASVRAGYRFD